MHKEILDHAQKKILPLLESFSPDFYLAGGTALALQIGHRKSIDFDLFSAKEFSNLKIRNNLAKQKYTIERVFKDERDQFTIVASGVKITFLFYPFKIRPTIAFENVKMPSILTLSAMKAYAISRRAKWKDYVDLYFVLENYFSLEEIVKEDKEIFGAEFNEKIFRESLAYFDDIDYSEEVIFTPGFEVKEKAIKKALINFATKI